MLYCNFVPRRSQYVLANGWVVGYIFLKKEILTDLTVVHLAMRDVCTDHVHSLKLRITGKKPSNRQPIELLDLGAVSGSSGGAGIQVVLVCILNVNDWITGMPQQVRIVTHEARIKWRSGEVT